MASKRAAGRDTRTQHWERRLASSDFKQALTAAVERELHHLSTLTFGAVVERKLVHRLIDDWDVHSIDQKRLTELILAASGAVNEVLRESNQSVEELLGLQTVKQIETLLFDDGALSDGVETFITELMQQDFTRQLFTEIIFTSMVSFNKKINPFGSFAMRAMEDQIKGFIRLFMPMIQTQAAAFAIDNQAAVLDLTRQLFGEALRQPLGTYLREPSARHKGAGAALLQQVLKSPELDAVSRTAAHAAWDSIYAMAGKLTMGELLRLDKHAEHLAGLCVEIILPVLRHLPILELLADELDAMRETPTVVAIPNSGETRPPAHKRKTSSSR